MSITVKRQQRGLSMVEMLVGVAIGLIVVAAAAMLVATQLAENRRLLLETQIQQDLRATADIVAREIRRAGAWARAREGIAVNGGAATANPYRAVDFGDGGSSVSLSYSNAADEASENNTIDTAERAGFRLNATTRVIESQLGAGGWQALTDAATLRVTEFSITARPVQTLRAWCPNLCPGGGEACWPELVVRDVEVAITGEAASDAAVRRSVRNRVRLRNDLVVGACPA